jgi:hypothetical protein
MGDCTLHSPQQKHLSQCLIRQFTAFLDILQVCKAERQNWPMLLLASSSGVVFCSKMFHCVCSTPLKNEEQLKASYTGGE